MADTGSSSQTGGSSAVPQSVNRFSVSRNPLSGISRFVDYHSDDSDNDDATAPQPVKTPHSINPLSDIRDFINRPIATATASRAGSAQHKDKTSARLKTKLPQPLPPRNLLFPMRTPLVSAILRMGISKVLCDEPEFQADHVVLYLREFCVPPKAVYPTKWRTNVDFSQTSFYVSLEKEFTDLEIVQSVRDHDPEVKVSSLACALDSVADQLRGTSQAASLMSTELGATKSDVCLTGYHIENSRKRRIEKSPRAAEIWEIPIAPSKPSTLSSSSSGFLGQEKVSSIHGTSTYTSKTSTTQTWRPSLRQSYSLLGYDLSKCRSAMALVNGNYTRILNLTHLVPEGEEVVWEGVTLKGDSGRSILVEADPNVVAELRRRDLHCVSPEQFGVLAGGDPLFGMQWKAPNSLIAKYEDWSLDLKAKDRLDATVYMNLALATHHPETVPDPPINKRSLKNVIDADTSDEVASPSKRQKRADGSGPTEYFLPSPPKSMIATPPPSPSSFSTISSCFEIEHPVNVEEWCLSVKQEASTDQSFVDTAIHYKPVTYTTAEKVFPREYWAHGDYINHFSRLSVTFVLATPTEVDVLLARAAKFGWGGAQGRG